MKCTCGNEMIEEETHWVCPDESMCGRKIPKATNEIPVPYIAQLNSISSALWIIAIIQGIILLIAILSMMVTIDIASRGF